MRKSFLAHIIGALILISAMPAFGAAQGPACDQGTPSEFLSTVEEEIAGGMFPVTRILNETDTQTVLDVVNPGKAVVDQDFETALLVVRIDGMSFVMPMRGGQMCGVFTLVPETTDKVLKALKGRDA